MCKTMSLLEILSRFKPFYKQYWFYFVLAIIGMLLGAGGTAGSAYVLEPILDKVFIEKNEALLYYIPFLVVIAYFAKSFGVYMQSFYISYIGTNILKTLREKVLQNLLNLDMKFFKQYRSGELISRCTNDINALQSIVSNIIPDLFRESITAIGLLAVVLYQSTTLAFFAFIILPLAILPLMLFARHLKRYARKIQEKNSDLLSRLSEIFTNIELIKANNAQLKESMKFNTQNDMFCKLNLKSIRIYNLSSPLMETVGSIGIAIVVIIGGKEVIEGNMSVGSFTSFTSALFLAYTPIKRISNLYNQFQTAISASERTFYLLDLRPEIKGGEKQLNNIEKLEFKNVNFAYDENKEVLKNVSFDFKRGESFGLVGPSGSGKSSIVGLILHFFEKQGGEILINNERLENFSLESLRSKISLVTQDIYMLNDTIAANVAFSENLDEENVIKALKLANAFEFVEKMGGIHTQLLENAKNLSGGQKQRIAIARALYKKPDLLIFDESTSALDNESEKAIVRTIENLKKEHLILIIAHRLSTIEKSDKIAVLKDGNILAIGNDEELLQTCTLYKQFKSKDDNLS
ncbi:MULTISPECIES: ABC transporter ATP-binding protein [unclassified Campylobacter]|uniref:ABC transporter ATP-binding protein n=1 Tax=unclassified Campylobacter TaxID=2593542 RepID=UPI001237A863|nr:MULTISPECIES: ABC transporter ATP-binding protein [unclassified Campylobacter]KAA6225357.1 ABC transporter ATP-binding protein [Campylobacter sp. LR185c]KAA6227053.1 ABC transporter ATP-binding protein [Campylobacter sp. LR196d]KAA6227624.1 ABC transporter ATP-binding protein [Campylobacter sp. LR286c]KAA6230828.1 ABC transporter ATP-binding protein [Campylobacter sp. LR291e]KAA8605006.1 ABC transporter permease [Campylobacter sp. LR185c]